MNNLFNVFMQTLIVEKVYQVRVTSKNFGFTQTRGNNNEVHVPKKEKYDSLVLSRSDLWMVSRCHGTPRVYSYYFCLEPTLRKDTWMRRTSVTVMVIFFKSGIRKITWSLLCSNFLLINYEAHGQQCFERSLQLYILRTWISIRPKSFIKF